jgi:phage host-nuclease inhibitor protein Gam
MEVTAMSEDLEPKQGWRISSLSELEWALERLADAQAEQATNEELKRQALARFEHHVATIQKPVKARSEFFEAAIIEYANAHRAELVTGKKKSRTFPGGTVGWRESGGGLTVVDEAACLAWAKRQDAPELLRVKEEVVKAALKAHMTLTGEIPDGCELVAKEDAPYVKATQTMLDIGNVTLRLTGGTDVP